MPLYLTEADVTATLSMADAVRVLDAAARKIADRAAAAGERGRGAAPGVAGRA
jgi:hypothetical protein